MCRKLLFGLLILAGTLMIAESTEAGWRGRAIRHGWYPGAAPVYYSSPSVTYAPPVYSAPVYATPGVVYGTAPVYAPPTVGYYGVRGYYGYTPGFGVVTPRFGVYVR